MLARVVLVVGLAVWLAQAAADSSPQLQQGELRPLWSPEMDPKHTVALHGAGTRLVPLPESRSYVMTNAAGRKYECSIPAISTAGATNNPATTPPEESEETLLEALENHCLYKPTGWWTFEYCHGKHIRQFHVEKEAVTAEFLLGRHLSSHDAPRTKLGDRYALHYGDGTKCDLTGAPRTAEVRFACRAEGPAVLVSVSEPSSCHYVVEVETPVLCGLAAYALPQVASTAINCVPLPSDDTTEPTDDESAVAATQSSPAPWRDVLLAGIAEWRKAKDAAGGTASRGDGASAHRPEQHTIAQKIAQQLAAALARDDESDPLAAIDANGAIVISTDEHPEVWAAMQRALQGNLNMPELQTLLKRLRAEHAAAGTTGASAGGADAAREQSQDDDEGGDGTQERKHRTP